MKIILDTNFLIYCAKNKLDYKEEISNLLGRKCELVVPVQVVNELKRLREKAKKLRDREACDLALQLLKANKIKIARIKAKNADNAILNSAKGKKGNIVATLDRGMRKKLGRVILISRGKRLRLGK